MKELLGNFFFVFFFEIRVLTSSLGEEERSIQFFIGLDKKSVEREREREREREKE